MAEPLVELNHAPRPVSLIAAAWVLVQAIGLGKDRDGGALNVFSAPKHCGTSFVSSQRVIGAPYSLPPKPWWNWKAQTKAPSLQWLFR